MQRMTDRASRVLIADDDEAFRLVAAGVLARAGFNVFEARNGAEVLEWVRLGLEHASMAPEVLVVDVRMPGLSGTEVLAEVRRSGCRTPVVLVTAACDDAVREAARYWRAAAVLEKPFEGETLVTAVANVTWLEAITRSRGWRFAAGLRERPAPPSSSNMRCAEPAR